MIPYRPGQVNRAIRFARHQIGEPYLFGGTGQGGFDCSGIVWAAYTKAGYRNLGRTTYEQIHQGIGVSPAHLRPGDIVFPSTHHEGLYIGHGLVLSAPHTGANVHVTSLRNFAPGGLIAARRLLAGGGGVVPPRAIGGQTDNGLPVPHPNPQLRLPSTQQISAAIQTLTRIQPHPAVTMQSLYPGTKSSPALALANPPSPAPANTPAAALDTLERLHESLRPTLDAVHTPRPPLPVV